MGKTEWMVIIPDHPNSLETRLRIRPNHLEGIKQKIQDGVVVFGGASLEEPTKEGESPKMNGSAFLAVAETKEEIVELVKSDVYYKQGVWNAEKMQIFPFQSAIRMPMK
ncbi:unnamed protein product [Cercospora beticola]|nr:unnamed protein product [Cercospora beticola]